VLYIELKALKTKFRESYSKVKIIPQPFNTNKSVQKFKKKTVLRLDLKAAGVDAALQLSGSLLHIYGA